MRRLPEYSQPCLNLHIVHAPSSLSSQLALQSRPESWIGTVVWATSWLFFFLLRLHAALLQQDSFDPSMAFGVVCADSTRATRAAHCSTMLISLGHIPAFLCDRQFWHGASSTLIFGLTRSLHCKSTGSLPLSKNSRTLCFALSSI